MPFAHRRLFLHTLAIATLAFAGACAANSTLTNLWKDPEYPREPMRNVFVVVVKRDAAVRRIWEDGFTREFEKRGVTATPSYRLFPDAPPDTEQVIRAVRDQGADGVVEVHRLPTQTTDRYVPGYATSVPVYRYNPWTGVYYTHYREIYEPGYVETAQVVRYQVNVWSVETNGGLVWTGTTETVDPSSTQSVNRQVSRLIVPELARKGVIQKVK